MATGVAIVLVFAMAACVVDRRFLSPTLFAWALGCGFVIYATILAAEMLAASVLDPPGEESGFLRFYSGLAALAAALAFGVSALVARNNKIQARRSFVILVLSASALSAVFLWALYASGHNFGWE